MNSDRENQLRSLDFSKKLLPGTTQCPSQNEL